MNGQLYYPQNINEIYSRQLPTTDLLKELLDFSGDLEKFEMSLRNQVETIDYKNKKRNLIQRGDPLLNKEGVNMISNIVSSHLSNVFKMSNFSENDVNMMAEEVDHELIDLLAYNYKRWEVRKENLSAIVQIVDHFIFAMLKSSYNEGIRKLLQMIEKRETKINPDQERKSIIPKIGSIKGGG